jgi:hypothetical protein
MRRRWKLGHYDLPMMSDEVFRVYHTDSRIRAHIGREAVYLTKDTDLQEDLVAVAWARIAQCLPGQSTEYYTKQADIAMRNEKWKVWAKRTYHVCDEELLSRAEYDFWRRGVP